MTSGNYIHDLQMTVRTLAAALDQIYEVQMDLVSYLTSPKFNEDTTVQVNDVLRRIAPITSALLAADDPMVERLTRPVVATGNVVLE